MRFFPRRDATAQRPVYGGRVSPRAAASPVVPSSRRPIIGRSPVGISNIQQGMSNIQGGCALGPFYGGRAAQIGRSPVGISNIQQGTSNIQVKCALGPFYGGRVSSCAAQTGRSPIINSTGQRPVLAVTHICRLKAYHQCLGATPRDDDARPSALNILFHVFVGLCPTQCNHFPCTATRQRPTFGQPNAIKAVSPAH